MKVNRQNMMEQQKKGNSSTKKEDAYLGVAVHSQVRKIKQEMDKINHPALKQPQEIIRPGGIAKLQQHSRSPLGKPERPFPLGNS